MTDTQAVPAAATPAAPLIGRILDGDGHMYMHVDMLRQVGFEMSEAANGEMGLEQAQALQPDLILMDIRMPGMDGLETTRRLRALPALKNVPVVALSASASGSDREQTLMAGMNAFLPKPIDNGSLLEHIATLLQTDAAPSMTLSTMSSMAAGVPTTVRV